ncbi:MAG: hypothetical protein FJX75_05120 [Armatimonadetes bacterium]|nr:hypothetical protein [Armatimonadota bacterium]
MRVLLLASLPLLVTHARAEEACRLVDVGAQGRILRNEHIVRRIPRPEQLPCTAEVWPVGGPGVAFEDQGFLIRLEGGVELGPRDFRWESPTAREDEFGVFAATLGGVGKSVPLRLRLEYAILPEEPFMWKRLHLQAADAPVLVRDVQVERLKTPVPTDLGGLGQPVFIDNRGFVGLEYPAADNLQREGLVTLEHHPGKRLEPGARWWTSKMAVLGIADGQDAATAFRHYVSRIRRPPKPLVVYNSWYDVQRGEMSVPVLLERAKQLHEELAVKRGAPFEAVVLDDGWQDVQSIWEIDRRGFPNEFDELHSGLKAMGVSLSLWHPLTAMKYNLDTEWGAANGYEVSPDKSFFCLAGPKYNAALRDELRRHTTQYEVAYYKHDFNAFHCAGEGHGHLPEAVYGREANVDAELAMFDYLTELNPRVYLNPSGGMWLSPWWLMHVDTVWMQYCSDFGYNKEVVAYEPRDWEMTYRDAMLWRNLYGDRAQFPIASIMTIGIIDGKLNRLGGEHEPLDRWANNVMVNMGRGSLLQELYITPSLLSQQQWDILASALKWQRQYAKQMAQGRMLPADPRWGGVYGWVHLDEGGGFVCLRNPGIVGQRVTVALPELDPRFWCPAQRVYPWLEDLDLRGRRLEVEVEPFGVTVVQIGQVLQFPARHSALVAAGPDSTTYDVWGLPGTSVWRESRTARMEYCEPIRFPGQPYHLWDVKALDDSSRRFGVTVDEGVDWRFVVVAHGAGKTRAVNLLVDGAEVKAQRVSGEGWELFLCDVPKGGHEVAWTVPDAAQVEPFAAPGYSVESFFVREAKLVPVRVTVACEAADPPRPLPETPNAGIERSTWVGPKVTIEAKQGPPSVAVTEQDLAAAKAAKLHIKVFGSQGGDDYGRKWVVLNGQRIAAVPVNSNASEPDAWESFVIDLSPAQTRLLKVQNEVAIETETGDCFKFADLALAVELADGRWAETEHSDSVWCSAPGWAYDEGKSFSGKTPGIRLAFKAR